MAEPNDNAPEHESNEVDDAVVDQQSALEAAVADGEAEGTAASGA